MAFRPLLRYLAAGPLVPAFLLLAGTAQARVLILPGQAAGTVESKGGTQAAAGTITLEDAARIPQRDQLRLKGGMTVPIEPFSLEGLAESRKISSSLKDAWKAWLATDLNPKAHPGWAKDLADPDHLPAKRYAFYHGLSVTRLRSVLGCYYDGVDSLSAEDVFALAPWVTLGLRHVISSTLLDVTLRNSWYEIGFFLDVAPECFYRMDPADAFVPMEVSGSGAFDQTSFRAKFRSVNPYTQEQEEEYKAGLKGKGPLYARTFKPEFEKAKGIRSAYGPMVGWLRGPKSLFYNPELARKGGLLTDEDAEQGSLNKDSTNEVAFFSRISQPDRSVRITAVVVTGKGISPIASPGSADDKGLDHYIGLARALAGRFHVPFYDLRPAKR